MDMLEDTGADTVVLVPAIGRGGGFQMFCFYPIPILLALALSGGSVLSPVIKFIGIGLAALQFPFFGFFISYARTKKDSFLFTLLKVAVWLHVIVSLLFLMLVLVFAG